MKNWCRNGGTVILRVALLSALSLMLMACETKEEKESRLARISELESKMAQQQRVNDSLAELIQSEQKILDSIKEIFSHETYPILDQISQIEYSDGKTSSFAFKMIFGRIDSLDLKYDFETENDFYSLQDHLNYIDFANSIDRYTEEYDFTDHALSNNSPDIASRYLFEYFGDVAGGYFLFDLYPSEERYGNFHISNQWMVSLFQRCSPKTLEKTVNIVCQNIYTILEHRWPERTDREQLVIPALKYVLETTELVDYSATTSHGKFDADLYEENWNGVQKFFYRTEQKFPGSTDLIRTNINEYIVSAELLYHSIDSVVAIDTTRELDGDYHSFDDGIF